MAFILGINAYHGDSSAALIKDGVLVAAAEEERFRRVKHWAGLPVESVRYCLSEAGIGLGELSDIAINQDSKAALWRKIGFALSKKPDPRLILEKLRNRGRRTGLVDELSTSLGARFKGQFHAIEHHLAHLSSAFHISPYEDAVTVSVDGFGDFSSAAWGVGRGRDITVEGRVYFPHSLGVFYQAMTQWLGFPHYGDEYKVMGLAPYGRPQFMPEMRQIVLLQPDGSFCLNLDLFRHHREKVDYVWQGGEPKVGTLYSKGLEDLLGPARRPDQPLEQRHKDIAHSIQAMYEEAFFHLLNALYQRHAMPDLCLAGGCAMNSVANGKVYRNTPFKRVYVQSAAGDAGGAIGAAYAVWHAHGGSRGFVMDHAYWGPEADESAISKLLTKNHQVIVEACCEYRRVDDEAVLCHEVASAIAEGKVIGWFQGRMEWGPRALGNRSILGDPRRADMKDILNLKIKRRESFRPFAPSILREAVPDWFEQDDEVPFMMQVYPVRVDKRAQIPAVTHVDGSGRLQTVVRGANPRYYRLIESFAGLTGVPILLNTSFNENEPVVCRPEEALQCFLRTKMDVLVLGNWIVRRAGGD